MDGTGGGLQLAGDQLNDGGLTGTGRSDQEYKFTIFNLHGCAVQRIITLLIGFYNIGKLNHM